MINYLTESGVPAAGPAQGSEMERCVGNDLVFAAIDQVPANKEQLGYKTKT